MAEMITRTALAVATLLAASCAVDPADEPAHDVATTTQQVARDPVCPEFGCGGNAATVGDWLVFDVLDSRGFERNSGGVRIAGVTLPSGELGKVVVERDELTVQPASGGAPVRGAALHGTIIKLDYQDREIIELRIEDVDKQHVQYWTTDHQPVWAYKLMARLPEDPIGKFEHFVCKGSRLEHDPGWGGKPYSALVFEGDRYDGVAKTVAQTSFDDPWFRLACAGTAPAKMHLLRHTLAGAHNDPSGSAPTHEDQRTAMLKMLTADYCGTGTSHTQDGWPLRYMDATGRLPAFRLTKAHELHSIEAIWGPRGAECLDVPRRTARHKIPCADELPMCESVHDWTIRGHVISANPRVPVPVP